MSGLPYSVHVALAHEQGVRLIGYDRPGYGGSTRQAGRRVADCVDQHAKKISFAEVAHVLSPL